MVIRTYENMVNYKGALIHEGHKCFLVELFHYGVIH
jgi:hypothetical protein